MFPINIVTRRSPLVKIMMLKTTSSQSVVLSRFPKVLMTSKRNRLLSSHYRARINIMHNWFNFFPPRFFFLLRC